MSILFSRLQNIDSPMVCGELFLCLGSCPINNSRGCEVIKINLHVSLTGTSGVLNVISKIKQSLFRVISVCVCSLTSLPATPLLGGVI